MTSFRNEDLRAVRSKRLYELIAEQIRNLITGGDWPEGMRLPSEKELAERFSVSRPTLREAMIALETLGLVEVRNGEGIFVTRASSRVQVGVPNDMGPGPVEQFQARRVLECACAELAAAHATQQDQEALAKSLARLEVLVSRNESAEEEHENFHILLARSSRNSILAQMVQELWKARRGPMWATLRGHVAKEKSLLLGIKFRKSLLAALRKRDADKAGALMRAHMDRVEKLYFVDELPIEHPQG